jgi:transcriptional regulator with XRE-family HTH domain
MSKFLGNNIRTLRNYYNESREELAEILGFELSTISNYELGYRIPDVDTLKKIAKHFNISVDVLMNEDISIIKSININRKKIEELNNIYELLFPIIATKDDLKNKKFKNAYEKHRKLFNGDLDDIEKEAFDIYDLYKELSNTGNIHSIINMLSVCSFLKFNLLIFTPENIKIFNQTEDLNNSISDVQIKNIIKNELNDLKEESKYKKTVSNFISQCTDIVFDLIKKLKNNNYSDIADYYLAVSCIYNLIDNNNTKIENQTFGNEYIGILVKLENKYAIQFDQIIDNIIDINLKE